MAMMIQNFKSHLEVEEEEEAQRIRQGCQSQLNPDDTDVMLNSILK